MGKLALLLFSGILIAQPITVGLKAGVPLTDDLSTYWAKSESKRYLIGPAITARLPIGLSLEFSALYRRVGYRTGDTDILGGTYFRRDRGNSWEFPLVMRRTLWRGIYVGIGYAPRIINGHGDVVSISVTSINPISKTYREFSVPGYWDTTHGIIGAAGIERRVGPLRIAPEIRYVRWNKPAIQEFGSRGFSIESSQNQVDILIGITFP